MLRLAPVLFAEIRLILHRCVFFWGSGRLREYPQESFCYVFGDASHYGNVWPLRPYDFARSLPWALPLDIITRWCLHHYMVMLLWWIRGDRLRTRRVASAFQRSTLCVLNTTPANASPLHPSPPTHLCYLFWGLPKAYLHVTARNPRKGNHATNCEALWNFLRHHPDRSSTHIFIHGSLDGFEIGCTFFSVFLIHCECADGSQASRNWPQIHR